MALDSIHQKFLDSWKEFVVTLASLELSSNYKFSIFGGALRDEIAGLSQYNDIDLYIGEGCGALTKNYIWYNIDQYFEKNKLKILNLDKFTGSFKFEPTLYGNNLEKDSFTFEVEDIETKERASIKVDFVRSTEKLNHPAPNYGANLDADVNSLYYHNGEVKSTLKSSSEKEHLNFLKANIEKGKYFRTNSCRSDRTKKLKIWAEKVAKVATSRLFKAGGNNKTEIALEAAKAQGFEVKNLSLTEICEEDLSGVPVKKIKKKEEEKNMANSKKTVIERNVESMNAAIYLGGAMKIEDLAQKLILAIAAKAGLNDTEMDGIHKILKHELFGCALSVGIGNAIPVIPGLENNPQAEKLADNMRVLGYAKAGVTGVNALLDKLLPEDCSGLIEQVNNIVGSLPAAEKVRVADSNDDVDVDFEEEENVKSNVSSLRVANGRNRLG